MSEKSKKSQLFTVANHASTLAVFLALGVWVADTYRRSAYEGAIPCSRDAIQKALDAQNTGRFSKPYWRNRVAGPLGLSRQREFIDPEPGEPITTSVPPVLSFGPWEGQESAILVCHRDAEGRLSNRASMEIRLREKATQFGVPGPHCISQESFAPDPKDPGLECDVLQTAH